MGNITLSIQGHQTNSPLFISRSVNHKLEKYVSRRADPKAMAIDAFSLTWANECYFIFPPFSLIGRILKKSARRQNKSHADCPNLEYTKLVAQSPSSNMRRKFSDKANKQQSVSTTQAGKSTSNSENAPGCFSHISGQRNNIIHTFRSGCHSVEHILTPFNPLLT